jgi:hypothetical protein
VSYETLHPDNRVNSVLALADDQLQGKRVLWLIFRERRAEAVVLGVRDDNDRGARDDEARLTRLRFLLVFEGKLDLGAINEFPAVTDVNVLLNDIGDPRSRTEWLAVLIASAAASSQEVVLVPMTSITR